MSLRLPQQCGELLGIELADSDRTGKYTNTEPHPLALDFLGTNLNKRRLVGGRKISKCLMYSFKDAFFDTFVLVSYRYYDKFLLCEGLKTVQISYSSRGQTS